MRNQILFILSILALLMHPLSLSAQNSFSFSLDVNSAAGDQGFTSAAVSEAEVVTIQIFGKNIQNAVGVSVRFEYDANQVTYEGFEVGTVLPNAQALTEQGTSPTFVEIGLVSLGGQATVNNGLIGTIRFRTLSTFSGSAIRLARADLVQGRQIQSVPLNLRVELHVSVFTAPSPDFNGDRVVGFPDFLLFVGAFDSREGQEKYEAKYDLNSNGEIDFPDFLIFVDNYGQEVSTPSGGSGSGAMQVAIPDANLRAAIEAKLDKARGAPITKDEMATLTRLEAWNANIRNLTGLEFATSLIELDLGSNSISDVSVLSSVTSLRILNLNSNSISDVSGLSGLTRLEQLYLSNNSISDVSVLSGLTRLKTLKLSNNNISDVSALSGLTRLIELSLYSNSISDVSVLSGLTRLEILNLNSNSISDVSGLSGLTRLGILYLYANNVSGLAPLVANTGLGSGDLVDMRGNPLSATSISTHIPALLSRGVNVRFGALKPAVEE